MYKQQYAKHSQAFKCKLLFLKLFLLLLLYLQVATDKDNGILLYKEDHDPLALELYQGHIRLIYDIANYPPTTVYRYDTHTNTHTHTHTHTHKSSFFLGLYAKGLNIGWGMFYVVYLCKSNHSVLLYNLYMTFYKGSGYSHGTWEYKAHMQYVRTYTHKVPVSIRFLSALWTFQWQLLKVGADLAMHTIPQTFSSSHIHTLTLTDPYLSTSLYKQTWTPKIPLQSWPDSHVPERNPTRVSLGKTSNSRNKSSHSVG